jgi:hypothetical protein
MGREYWRRVAKRAFLEAAFVLGLNSRERIVIWLAIAAVAVIVLVFWGSADAAWDELVWRLGLVAIIILTFPFVFLWKMLSVPAKMDAEAATEREALALQRETKAEKDNRLGKFSELLVAVEELRQVKVSNDEEYEKFKADVSALVDRLNTELPKFISGPEMTAFAMRNVRSDSWGHIYRQEQNSTYSALYDWREQLRGLIDKYSRM